MEPVDLVERQRKEERAKIFQQGKRTFVLLLVGFVVGAWSVERWGTSPGPSPDSPQQERGDPVMILRVADGDTAVFQGRLAEQPVRLLHVDTAERGESGYQEAKTALAEQAAVHRKGKYMWQEIVGVLGTAVGVIGVCMTIVQWRAYQELLKRGRVLDWSTTKIVWSIMDKAAQAASMATELAQDKDVQKMMPNAPKLVELCSAIRTGMDGLLRRAVENIFLREPNIDERQVRYWKSTGLLGRHVVDIFNQLLIDPPEDWTPDEKGPEE